MATLKNNTGHTLDGIYLLDSDGNDLNPTYVLSLETSFSIEIPSATKYLYIIDELWNTSAEASTVATSITVNSIEYQGNTSMADATELAVSDFYSIDDVTAKSVLNVATHYFAFHAEDSSYTLLGRLQETTGYTLTVNAASFSYDYSTAYSVINSTGEETSYTIMGGQIISLSDITEISFLLGYVYRTTDQIPEPVGTCTATLNNTEGSSFVLTQDSILVLTAGSF